MAVVTRAVGEIAAFVAGDARTGRLAGIAWRAARREPMQLAEAGIIDVARGLLGDHKGPKSEKRRVTVLAAEDWAAAIGELRDRAGEVPLCWTLRRANLLVEGIRLPRAPGGRLRIGQVELEITRQTVPCKRMDEVHPGLLKALYPQWRGGVTCRVLIGGAIEIGSIVEVTVAPPEIVRRLP